MNCQLLLYFISLLEKFSYDLEKWFLYVFVVLSANGWKDQNIASELSCQRKPSYKEGVVRLANRVAVWRQNKLSVDF